MVGKKGSGSRGKILRGMHWAQAGRLVGGYSTQKLAWRKPIFYLVWVTLNKVGMGWGIHTPLIGLVSQGLIQEEYLTSPPASLAWSVHSCLHHDSQSHQPWPLIRIEETTVGTFS